MRGMGYSELLYPLGHSCISNWYQERDGEAQQKQRLKRREAKLSFYQCHIASQGDNSWNLGLSSIQGNLDERVVQYHFSHSEFCPFKSSIGLIICDTCQKVIGKKLKKPSTAFQQSHIAGKTGPTKEREGFHLVHISCFQLGPLKATF